MCFFWWYYRRNYAILHFLHFLKPELVTHFFSHACHNWAEVLFSPLNWVSFQSNYLNKRNTTLFSSWGSFCHNTKQGNYQFWCLSLSLEHSLYHEHKVKSGARDLRFWNQMQFQMLYNVVENSNCSGRIFSSILSSTFYW